MEWIEINGMALLEYERRPFRATYTDSENNIKFLLMKLTRKNYVTNTSLFFCVQYDKKLR